MSQLSNAKSPALAPAVAIAPPAGAGINWRGGLEAMLIPAGAIVASLILFGLFCFVQGANAFGVFGAIYKAAFGSWYSFQNTLVRASPLMLTALCTALPARL